MARYNPKEIEPKWQQAWEDQSTYRASDDQSKPKKYILEYFPYPSGAAMHVGHVRNYTIGDAMVRFMRMQGYNVLHPMGWDAFGLPAENYAIKTGISPREAIDQNTSRFKEQLIQMGFSYDWSREIDSTDPNYYKWTQWFFLMLFKRGLAYQQESLQWWCPVDKTVLANEQVEAGKCWRCGSEVEKKALKQWFFKITEYADRLAADLDDLNWSDGIKTMQRNWIGRSSGAEVDFKIVGDAGAGEVPEYIDTVTPFRPGVGVVDRDCAQLIVKHPTEEKYLLLHRATWETKSHSFPMGGVEDGEDPAEAVKRELLEETGYKNVGELQSIGSPYIATFYHEHKKINRRTKVHSYYTQLKDLDQVSVSEEEQQINVPSWLTAEEVRKLVHGEGAQKTFELYLNRDPSAGEDKITVYTTRPDTLFGATFMVLAPEHPLVAKLTTAEHKSAVDKYVKQAQAKSDIERQDDAKEKTGVFTGGYAINPVNDEKIPVWVADYVLYGYGTGAIMAVPAHDERDFAFAKKFELPIKPVVEPVYGEPQGDDIHKDKIIAIVRDPKTHKVIVLDWGPRNDRYGGNMLIGGSVEAGEDLIEAAKREIAEETGYTDVELVEQLEARGHGYFYSNVKNQNYCGHCTGLLFELRSDKRDDQALDEGEKDKFKVTWVSDDKVAAMLDDGIHETFFRQLVLGEVYSGEGVMINSGKYDGKDAAAVREQIVKELEKQGAGKERVNYKMRDWLISRQRYWGAPIPIVHCPKDGAVAVPDARLPVKLPDLKSFEPSGDGRSPLANVKDFVETECPECGGPAERETDTMDGFACSSWYFLRFADPNNHKEAFDKELAKFWLPVDDYIGGAEHAVMHLLYARFWTKVMYDEGLIDFQEPFKTLRNQGMILAPDGQKMSKSKGNTIEPDSLIEQGYGADSIRIMELFIGPWNQVANWSVEGMGGAFKFLNRIWVLTQDHLAAESHDDASQSAELQRAMHQATKRVTEDLHDMGFNTSIAALMELVNELYKLKTMMPLGNNHWQTALEVLVKLLAPFAPHVAEELWQQLGGEGSVHVSEWPVWDEAVLQTDTIKIVVQVNGKVRANIHAPADASEAQVLAVAQADEKVAGYLDGKTIKKQIYVPGRLINLVVG